VEVRVWVPGLLLFLFLVLVLVLALVLVLVLALVVRVEVGARVTVNCSGAWRSGSLSSWMRTVD
jgi:hypothetical protein